MPWTGLENGATAEEPRSNRVDDAIDKTPSDWPTIVRFTQLGALLSVSKSAVRSALAVDCKNFWTSSESSQQNLKLPLFIRVGVANSYENPFAKCSQCQL